MNIIWFSRYLLVFGVMPRTITTRTILLHTVTMCCNDPQGDNNFEFRNNHEYYQQGGCAKTLYNTAEIISHILHIAHIVTSYNIPVDLLMCVHVPAGHRRKSWSQCQDDYNRSSSSRRHDSRIRCGRECQPF